MEVLGFGKILQRSPDLVPTTLKVQCVVMTGVTSPLIWVIIMVTLLRTIITPLMTAKDPPSRPEP